MSLLPDFRRALSIRQPWAWLILRPDLLPGTPERAEWFTSPQRKDVENRIWQTSYRGELWIHAGNTFDVAGFDAVAAAWPEIPLPPIWRFSAIMGGIVGRVTLTDVVSSHTSRWKHDDQYGWILTDPVPCPLEPMPGRQGLFRVGDAKPPPLNETE